MSKRRAERVLRVLGYARVSSVAQGVGSSLKDQQNAITEYAAARGYPSPILYVEAESGGREKIEARHRMRDLQANVKEGDLVLCHRLDRWSRDAEFSYKSIREILAAGASFFAIDDRVDPGTSEGDTALGFRILFAREEHKRIRQRMVGTRELLRDRGYYADGLVPLGYRRALAKGEKGPDKNVLMIVDEEAALVRRAFSMCIGGKSLSEIGLAIGRDKDAVQKLLRSRVYVGEIRNTQDVWIRGKHEAIVDVDIFTRAAAALSGRRHGKAQGTTSETADWVLRDIARCALCGARMSAAYAGPHEARRYYFRCFKKCTSSFVPVRAAEAAAEPLIVARIAELREELAQDPKAKATTVLPDVSDRRAKLQAKRDRYIEAHANGLDTLEGLRGRLAKLDVELLHLEGLLVAARKVSPLEVPGTRRKILKEISGVAKAWRKATLVQRREIVGLLAHSVALAAGVAPVFTWRKAEELAETEG